MSEAALETGKKLKNEHRIIINYDLNAMWLFAAEDRSSAAATRSLLEDIIAEHAAVGVDMIAHGVFARFTSHLPSSKVADLHHLRPPRLDEEGLDFLAILIERCRKHNIEFIACLRMNDRHGGGTMGNKGQFIKDHPEWHLKDFPGGLDYTHDGVRLTLLTFIREMLEGYDVDGIEFDYMRWCHMFEGDEGRSKAPLLTDFVRRTRELLDVAAQRRGRGRLVLGVRVPQTLEECDYLGFDVATWIREGLVDFVVPSDFHFTDFNTKVEDFVTLAKGTDCKIYPAIQPSISWGNDAKVMDLANYRAAARNFYTNGADGLEVYNYEYHWELCKGTDYAERVRMWREALGYLRQLRDPEEMAQGDRHYLFYPLWDRPPLSPTGFAHDDRIFLDRQETAPQASQRFRVAEDFNSPSLRVRLQFKAVGLAEDDALEIRLNGTRVLDSCITRVFHPDGQKKSDGRELPAFYLYSIEAGEVGAKLPIISGDNELTVCLLPTQGKRDGRVTIEELEFYVAVKSSPAQS